MEEKAQEGGVSVSGRRPDMHLVLIVTTAVQVRDTVSECLVWMSNGRESSRDFSSIRQCRGWCRCKHWRRRKRGEKKNR